MSNSLGNSPTDSTSSVEINDCIFCEHGKEVCEACQFDGREDNDAFFGFDATPRDPIETPAYTKNAKDGSICCKKHNSSTCGSCFGWKKQITKLHKEGAKKAKTAAKNKGGSNLFV